jgi:glycine cleavage system aminomethyltransferase T
MRTCNVQQEKLQKYGLIINYGLNMIILNKLATSNFIPKHNEKYCAYAHTRRFGSKMLPFAGYNMPTWRNKCRTWNGSYCCRCFDVSHMGEFYLQDLMHWLWFKSNFKWCLSLTVGKAQYSCLPNNDGGIVDDLIIYKKKSNIY